MRTHSLHTICFFLVIKFEVSLQFELQSRDLTGATNYDFPRFISIATW